MDYDLEAFRLPTSPHPPVESSQPKRERATKPFVKGPIPLIWLSRAALLPGKSPLLIGLALFYLAGLRKTQRGLKLTKKTWEQFGIKRRTSYDALEALEALEDAGLVSVERKSGSSPVVDILSQEKPETNT